MNERERSPLIFRTSSLVIRWTKNRKMDNRRASLPVRQWSRNSEMKEIRCPLPLPRINIQYCFCLNQRVQRREFRLLMKRQKRFRYANYLRNSRHHSNDFPNKSNHSFPIVFDWATEMHESKSERLKSREEISDSKTSNTLKRLLWDNFIDLTPSSRFVYVQCRLDENKNLNFNGKRFRSVSSARPNH